MDTMGERLRWARKQAGFQSAMKAAQTHGWPTSTYSAHENGQNLFPVDRAEIYGRAFKVSTGWLLSGEGEIVRRNLLTVAGLVGAGGEIDTSAESLGPDGLDEIELPFALSEDAAGYRVRGDSMWPRYDDGDIVVVSKRGQSPAELLHVPEAMVTTADGARYLKRITKGSHEGTYDLESYNWPPRRGVNIASAASVLCVVRRGEWRALTDKSKKRTVQRRLRSS